MNNRAEPSWRGQCSSITMFGDFCVYEPSYNGANIVMIVHYCPLDKKYTIDGYTNGKNDGWFPCLGGFCSFCNEKVPIEAAAMRSLLEL